MPRVVSPAAEALDRPPKMSEVLADRLRARILGEGLPPGRTLSSEPEIIARYRVGRATVREALRLLEADGLIEIRRGRGGGIVVREPDLGQSSRSIALLLAMRGTTVRALCDYRLLIEPAAAAAAARNATKEQVRWLLELAEQPSEPNLGPAVDFHDALGECSHNDLLRVSIAALVPELSWHVPGEALSPKDIAGTVRAHRALARAVESGDAERARAIMRRHIEEFRRVLERHGRLDQPIMPRERWLSRS